ncbi:BnaA05g19150D [Brassica napus]|uniref:BnaA05g19150D protein n=1 Tax=Brassica napus TaxID=3708 RepID=A0A078GJC9_BRANA|nr:BnaA05g19150D [Brassica napus]
MIENLSNCKQKVCLMMTDRVIPQSRCSPFTNGTADVTKEKEQKEEAVRLGVELSLCMAEAMFILSDDRRSMTYFCFFTLFKTKMDRRLAHIVSTLEIGCLVKPSVFEQYNRELKKLEENLGEAIETEILPLWKSLFETNSEVIKLDKTINSELLRPLLNELNKEVCARSLASLAIKPCK